MCDLFSQTPHSQLKQMHRKIKHVLVLVMLFLWNEVRPGWNQAMCVTTKMSIMVLMWCTGGSYYIC